MGKKGLIRTCVRIYGPLFFDYEQAWSNLGQGFAIQQGACVLVFVEKPVCAIVVVAPEKRLQLRQAGIQNDSIK